MKRKTHIILLVLLLLCVLSTTAFAIDESEVESAIAASSKEEVAGNVFIWFLCAIGFLKVSQKIDSFMASLGINVGRTGGSMLTELMVAGRGIAAVAGAVGGTVFNHHSSSNSTHTNAQAAGAAFTGGGNGLVGVTRRAAGNAAAASATGNAKGLSNLVGGAMFESSLQNGGKFAMSVVGAVAKGSISSVGSITGDQAAEALTSYLGYSPVDSGSALADDGGLIPPSPITSEDVVTLDGGTAAGTASPTASANGTPIPSGAREHDGSVVESARISGAPPIFQNVEIGGGRITGLEVSPDRQSDREFAIRDEQYKTVYVERGKCAQIEWENSAVTGQIQIRKYSSEDNTVTGQLAGTPLEGAVFEITQARSGKVVGYIVTDARGVAASGPLPLGRYFVTEVSAPKYYQLSGEKMEAEIEYPGQIIKLSAYNKPAALGVTIKKSGNYEVQSGQTMSYDFSGIANTSNVALNHFFWHDRIPTDATRALSISTGTYNARLYYKVTFKTNLNDYRTLVSNLLTANNYSLSLNAATLRLVQGEYVTDVRFEFGTVPSGFSSVVKPTMRVQVLGTVSNGYQIINRADVGGQYLNEWQTAKTTWVTTVRRFNTTPLPKTGY